jgi:hypothetical protein
MVALAEMSCDQSAMGAFTQWLGPNCSQAGDYRLGRPTFVCKPEAEPLQSMKPQLAETLALDHHPIVVPEGKQVACEWGVVVVGLEAPTRAEESQGLGAHLSHVNGNACRELQGRAIAFDNLESGLAGAPDHGSKVATGPLLRNVGPEDPCHRVPAHGMFAQRQEG